VRELVRRAIGRIDVAQLFEDRGGSNIYEAVYLTAQSLFPGRAGRKSIVLLTDGQDSGLGLSLASPRAPDPNRLTFEDVARALASEDIQLFAASTQNRPKIMTPDWLAHHSDASLLAASLRDSGIPAYTLFLAELVRRTGGQLYFMHETTTVEETFRRVARSV